MSSLVCISGCSKDVFCTHSATLHLRIFCIFSISNHPVAALSQGRLLIDHVVQLLVVVYSLSGDRMPPAPPLYSADEAEIKQALAEAIVTVAQQQQKLGGPALQLECIPGVQQLLQQVGSLWLM